MVALSPLSGTRNHADSRLAAHRRRRHHISPEPGRVHVKASHSNLELSRATLEAMIAGPPCFRSHGLSWNGLRLDGDTPSSQLFGGKLHLEHVGDQHASNWLNCRHKCPQLAKARTSSRTSLESLAKGESYAPCSSR